MQKFFNIVIIAFAVILLFFSTITFVIIQIELFSYNFKIDSKGLNNYLSSFTEFKELFAGTIILIVAYFSILRLKAAEVANLEKVKQDRFTEWKNQLDIRILEVEKNNPFFKRQFTKIRYKLFENLYEFKMSINSKEELLKVTDNELRKSLRFLEEMNDININLGGVYPDKTFTYFFNDFYFVFIGSLDNYYDNLRDDLKEIYLNSLNNERFIDKNLYEFSRLKYK